MRKKSIFIAIFLGLICLISILLIQYIWIKKALISQNTEIQLQIRKDSLNTIDFEHRTQIALREASIKIAFINNDVADRYGTVHKQTSNFYYIEFQGELQEKILEEILFREFDRMLIVNDFQFGIYDYQSNRMRKSNLFRIDIDDGFYTETDFSIDVPTVINPTKESNYFTIFFPTVTSKQIYVTEDLGSPWLFLVLVSLLVLGYLTYAVVIIVRQKRLADIKTDFINNMTHELKTPIATIKLSSTALLTGDFSDDRERLQRYASIIYSENKRLESQVEQVLTIAKMNKRSTPLKKEIVDVYEFIRDAYETFSVNLESFEDDSKISLNLKAKKHIVYVDPVHVKNVVFNLIDNAIKYRRDDVPFQLIISATNDKKNLIINFQDNGIGIDKSDLKLIFDKFYRVPKGDVHDVKGFGLGLYYVKNIIKQHQGNVLVRSVKGQGSTFTVLLPLKKIEED